MELRGAASVSLAQAAMRSSKQVGRSMHHMTTVCILISSENINMHKLPSGFHISSRGNPLDTSFHIIFDTAGFNGAVLVRKEKLYDQLAGIVIVKKFREVSMTESRRAREVM